MVAVVVVLLLLVGAAATWFLTQDKEDSGAKTNTDQNNNQANSTSPAEEYTTTTFTSGFQDGASASVSHPASWEVKTSSEDANSGDGKTYNKTIITSPSGLSLNLYNLDGLGGACDPDDVTYTLVKKLPTSTPDVFFTEYSYSESINGWVQRLSLEYFGGDYVSSTHAQLEEGQSNTDVCTNLFGYPSYGGVFVAIEDNNSENVLKYADIAADSEFVKMLQSLKITPRQ